MKSEQQTRKEIIGLYMKLNKSDLIAFLKDQYEYEQFRRNNFDNAIGLSITILALMIGGLGAIIFEKEKSTTITALGAAIALIPICTSAIYIIRVFFGFKRRYNVLPQSDIINQHYESLLNFHASGSTEKDVENIKSEVELSFQEDILKWYVECTKINCEVNDLRADYFHKAKLWLTISLFPVFVILVIQIIMRFI